MIKSHRHRVPHNKVCCLTDYHLTLNRANTIKGELPPCSLQMELFSAGKQTDCGEGKLLEVPCGEEGIAGKSEVKGIPLFISADLAEAAAINIISCTC